MKANVEKAKKYLQLVSRGRRNKYPDGIYPEVMENILEFLVGGNSGDVSSGTIRGFGADSSPHNGSIKEHDAHYHPEGFDPETDTCECREKMAPADKGDRIDNARSSFASVPGVSNKKAKEYRALMARKHPNIDAEKLLGELGKIKDKKVQGDAFRWVVKGAARLPEDLYKVEQARTMADRAKVDPLSYDTPQACIDGLKGEVRIKEKAIDPDTVPELSDKNVLPMGVTTYLVQDDREGQRAVRRIIDTHWGEDANPWCLLHGDGHGHLSDGTDGGYDAWHYWNHYNALPKRVAFKDGKLLAFMATDKGNLPRDEYGYENIDVDYDDIADSVIVNRDDYEYLLDEFEEQRDRQHGYEYSEFDAWLRDEHHDLYEEFYELKKDKLVAENAEEQWWDRQDASHEGIPLGNIPVPGDAFGRWADFEIRDGEMKQIGGYQKNVNGKKVAEWDDFGNLEIRNIGKGIDAKFNAHGDIVMFVVDHDASVGFVRMKNGKPSSYSNGFYSCAIDYVDGNIRINEEDNRIRKRIGDIVSEALEHEQEAKRMRDRFIRETKNE